MSVNACESAVIRVTSIVTKIFTKHKTFTNIMADLAQLLGSVSVMIILGFSACGSCYGMGKCGTASTLHSQIRTVLTYSYVSMIMISTTFFYGFILAIIIINRLGGGYSLQDGIHHLISGLIFGVVGLSAGTSMGNISSNCFKKIAQKDDFYMTFVVALASVEVTLVIGFLCSLLVIYKV